MFSHYQTRHGNVKVVDLPVIPPQVDLAQLDGHLRLITPDEFNSLTQHHLADGRYSKHLFDSTRTIAILNNEIHAVSPSAVGRGAFGAVKASQCIQTGEWEICKITAINCDNEAAFLDKMGLLVIAGDPDKNDIHYQSRRDGLDKKALFMRYIPGYTLNSIESRPHTSHQWMLILIELMKAVKELASKQISHGDFKDPNILYDFLDSKLHFIDFGLATDLNDDDSNDDLDTALFSINYWLSNDDHSAWIKSNVAPFIKTELAVQSQTRMTTAEVINHCNRIIEHLTTLKASMPESERKYHIGVIDVSAYKHHQINLDDLQQYAEIWLVDRSAQLDLRDYLECRQGLQLSELWVGDKVLVHPSFFRLTYHLNEMCLKRHPECFFIFTDVITGIQLDCKHLREQVPDISAMPSSKKSFR